MNRLVLPLIAALALCVVAGWGMWQRAGWQAAARALSEAQAEIATLSTAAAQARDAEAELDKHLRRVAEERDRWAALARETDGLEGADEPLSPYLRGILDRVR